MYRVLPPSVVDRFYPPRRRAPRCSAAIVVVLTLTSIGLCQQQVGNPTADEAAGQPKPAPSLPAPPGATRLDAEQPVWIDAEKHTVYVDGKITLREGVLEMFACPAGTKEHESVVAVDSSAELIHVALLAVGAESGRPVRYEPKYQPPTGSEIEVRVSWLAEGSIKSVRAQEWVRHADTKKAMDLPFVFAGSRRWTDPETKVTYYGADGGDLICVSNFATAMLDVPAPSTDNNGGLWFEPYTEHIPAEGTPVRLALKPVRKSEKAGDDSESTPAGIGSALAVVLSAKPGTGAEPAFQEAWQELAMLPPAKITQLLTAMKDASPLALNYLRMAVDAIADRIEPDQMPAAALLEFLENEENASRARRTAFELIRRVDPAKAEGMLDDLIDDPSDEIRFDAVAKLLKRAEAAEGDQRITLLRQVLASARSLDQLETAERRLEKQGVEVDLAEVLGMVTRWRVIGPFDNRGGIGFDTPYPPEDRLDPAATYSGHDEDGPQGPFGWKSYQTDDRLGEIEFNEALGEHKGAVGYAWATIESDKYQPVAIRYSSKAATKVWLNGYLVAENPTYHSGSPFDQYRADGELKMGKNTILVKLCQNEQSEPWAQVWPLHLRLTDPAGGPLEAIRQAAIEASPKTSEP